MLLFDWDEDNVRHIRRHRVTPGEVEEVLGNDPLDFDYEAQFEPRFKSLGITRQGRILVVVWTLRGDRIRAVTAFDAPKSYVRIFTERRGS